MFASIIMKTRLLKPPIPLHNLLLFISIYPDANETSRRLRQNLESGDFRAAEMFHLKFVTRDEYVMGSPRPFAESLPACP